MFSFLFVGDFSTNKEAKVDVSMNSFDYRCGFLGQFFRLLSTELYEDDFYS